MRLIPTLLLCSASIIGISTPVMAQDTAPQAGTDEAAENVIIVQTRRRDEAIQDVPAVIGTVTAEQVGKLNIRDFSEVSNVVPGLQLTSQANGIGAGAKLRGVNFDVNASGTNPTVEFYFNDAPVAAGLVLQQMYDIGQIEVQRGPQGTLRGRASPSGAITVTAKKPDLHEIGGFVDMTANDIGTLNFKGGLNLPVIEGIAAIRVAGVWDENEVDRVRPMNGNRDPFARTKSGRISALVQPTDWLKLEGMYQRLDRRAHYYDQIASFSEVNPDAPASPVYVDSSDRLSNMEGGHNVRQIFDVYNWRAEASAMGQMLIYQGQRYTQKINGDENMDKANLFPGDYMMRTLTRARTTSHEVRLQNDQRVLDMFDYVVGFFDYKSSTPSNIALPTILVLSDGTLLGQNDTTISRVGRLHEQSFFGNLTVHVTEDTEVSGGLRHIAYNDFNDTLIGGNSIGQTSQDEKKWIYTASVKHNFTPDLMVYASTGSSWRPGINVIGDFNRAPSPLEQSFLSLPPESSKSYEIGFKSTLLGGRVRLNATAFHQKFKNYPYRVGGEGVYYILDTGAGPRVDQFNFVGAVPVEVNGVEGDLAVDINDNWSVNLTASYSVGKIKDGLVPCNDLTGDGVPDSITSAPSLADLQNAVGSDNLAGCRVSQRSGFQSPFSATITSEYRVPISDKMDGYLRGLVNFNGNSRVDPTNIFDDVDSYGLVNLYAGVRDPNGAWEISLFAKNLFDTTKTLTRTDPLFTSYTDPVTRTSSTFTSTYTGVTTTAPREFGINIRYAFGSR